MNQVAVDTDPHEKLRSLEKIRDLISIKDFSKSTIQYNDTKCMSERKKFLP